MLKILIKKQFLEVFKGYFVSSKTGKAKSLKSTIMTFVLFIFVLGILAASFFGMGYTVGELLSSDYAWLYYTLFGSTTIILGTFVCMFSASTLLYNSKDNELLLSMPIKPSTILVSRVLMLYGLCFIYSNVVWISICLYALINEGFVLSKIIIDIILMFVIPLLSSCLSCLLGYVVALISSKAKNKSIVTTIVSLIFLGVYYYVCFSLSDIIDNLVLNGDKVASAILSWAKYLYLIGKASEGDVLSLIILIVINSIVAVITYVLLSKNFIKLAISPKSSKTSNNKVSYKSSNSIGKTLLKKEVKRFTSSSTYLMNCGLGVIFVLAAGIGSFIKKEDILLTLQTIKPEMPLIYTYIPLMIIGVIGLISSVGQVAIPSLSLEGKSLWILKSLPLDTYQILDAKKKLQLLLNGIPAIIAGVMMSYAFELSFNMTVYICVTLLMFFELQACLAVLLSLISPNFNWTNETQPIKQSIFVLVSMVVSLIIIVLMLVPYYFVQDRFDVANYLQYMIMIMIVMILMFRKLLRSWGVNKFESL